MTILSWAADASASTYPLIDLLPSPTASLVMSRCAATVAENASLLALERCYIIGDRFDLGGRSRCGIFLWRCLLFEEFSPNGHF